MGVSRHLSRDRCGVTLVEYTIMIGLISAVAMILMSTVSEWVEEQWNALAEEGCKLPDPAQGRKCDPPGGGKGKRKGK